MKIDRRLNLVIPVDRDDGTTLYAFSSPISREVFENYFLVISKTFSRIIAEGLQLLGGPRVCAMMLRDTAMNTLRSRGVSWWEGPDGVENGLMNEVRRLTNVLVPREGGGWESTPYADAVSGGLLDAEEVAEIEGGISFFTVNYYMHKRQVVERMLESVAGMWAWQITSSTLSDYRTSLTTSTPAAPTGGTVTPSSIPS